MRDPLQASARRRGWGRGSTTTGPSRARLIGGGLLFVALIAATSGGGANAASLLDMLFPTTTRPAPATTTTTAPTSTTASTTATTVQGNDSLTLKDTGFTKIRLTIDSQTAWATVTMDGTSIQASKVVQTTGSLQIMSMGPTITVTKTGRAVIDFVLQIPTGANTGLSTCKNYQGPATFTLTRLTGAATEIAKVNSTGTNGHPPQGQCENQLHRDVSRASFIGPVRWPARRDPRPLVLAHYFPWYNSQNIQQNFGPDLPVYPANTDDQPTVTEAVDLAARSGIDAFIVEYEGNPINTARIPLVVAAADAKPGFKLAYTLDLTVIQWHGGGTISPDALDAGLNEVTGYAGHPSQLFTDGKPVVFVYGADKISTADWQAGLDRLHAATGITPYVVAETTNLSPDAIYKFGTYGLNNQQALNSWSVDMLWQHHLQLELNDQPVPVWAAPVSPGYDDRALHREQSWSVDRANGQRYDQEWTASLASLPDWIVVTTWNEYYEQTHVAPGNTTAGRAVDQTAYWAGRFHTTG